MKNEDLMNIYDRSCNTLVKAHLLEKSESEGERKRAKDSTYTVIRGVWLANHIRRAHQMNVSTELYGYWWP